jgi:DegV family protein with EDD domain
MFKSELKARGIEHIPMSYCFDTPVYDTFDSDADYENFYQRLKNGELSTTSQANSVEYAEYYDGLVAAHPDTDILHLVLSSGLSGTYEVARAAAEAVNQRLGKKRIYCLDSLAATQGMHYQLTLMEACRDKGMTAAETEAYVTEVRGRQHHFLLTSDLFHLYRGGRLSRAAATVGSILHIKPIIVIDSKGRLNVYDKVVGIKKALKYVVAAVKKYDADLSLPVFLAHGGKEIRDEFLALLAEKYPDIKPVVGWIGPVIGTHTGCDALGFVFAAKTPRFVFKD